MTTGRELFRKNALQRHSGNWVGSIRIASPPSHALWSICFASLGLALCILLYFGEYTRREKAVGHLVAAGGVARIPSPTSGYVTTIKAVDGQAVLANQPLIDVTNELYSGDLVGVKESAVNSLGIEIKAIESDIQLEHISLKNKERSMISQIALLKAKLNDTRNSLKIYVAEDDQLNELLNKTEPLLESGYVSAAQVQQQRSTIAANRSNQARQLSEISSISLEIERLRSEVAQIPIDSETKINELSRQLENAKAQRVLTSAEKSTSIRTPIDGFISSILVTEGQAVQAGQAMLTVTKHDAALEAQLLVNSSAIGFVAPGTPVALKIRAFPFQKFGVVMGTVISRTLAPLPPDEATSRTGIPDISESMFLVRVRLNEDALARFGERTKLGHGMYVDAELLLESRRLYEWLFRKSLVKDRNNHE